MNEVKNYEVISCTAAKRWKYDVTFKSPSEEVIELLVHEELVVEFRLVAGKQLDETAFEKLQESLGYGQAYSYAISILARRMYTEHEVREKLLARETEEHVIEAVVQKLLEIQLLDDAQYTKFYIESQVEAGKKSKERIVADLRVKGISRHTIEDFEELFDETRELAVIQQELKRCWRRFANKELTDYERKAKIMQAVVRKGFDADDVISQYEIFVDER